MKALVTDMRHSSIVEEKRVFDAAGIDIDTTFCENEEDLIRNGRGAVEGQVLTFRDVTALKRMSETIDYQASHDILTGLTNRKHFSMRLDELIADLAWHFKWPLSELLDLDVDEIVHWHGIGLDQIERLNKSRGGA